MTVLVREPFQAHGNGVGNEGGGIIPISESDGAGDQYFYTDNDTHNLSQFSSGYYNFSSITSSSTYLPGSTSGAFNLSLLDTSTMNFSTVASSSTYLPTFNSGSHNLASTTSGSHNLASTTSSSTNLSATASDSDSNHPPFARVLKIMRIY